MKLLIWPLTALACALAVNAWAQDRTGQLPSEEECMGLLAVLPTFQSPAMESFYQAHRDPDGRQVVEKLRSVAESGDKAAQFTYAMLLSKGYCVPKDLCEARRFLEKSRGGPHDWEKDYPVDPQLKGDAQPPGCR